MPPDIKTDLRKLSPEIFNQISSIKKLKNLGENFILFDPKVKITWIVNSENEKLRAICGHFGKKGYCFQSAGWGTEHPGAGKCRHHSKGKFYSLALSEQYNYPIRLVDLIDSTADMEEKMLSSLDPEIKMLYALQHYILTAEREENDLSLSEIELVKDIVKDLVKTKALRNKIQRELRLDASSVKEFVHQIFGIIVKHVQGPNASQIMNDIVNEVLIPFRSKDRIQGKDIEINSKVSSYINKAKE